MTKKYQYKGKHLTIMELTKLTGLSYELIYSRLRAGDTIEQATRGKHPGASMNGKSLNKLTCCIASLERRLSTVLT